MMLNDFYIIQEASDFKPYGGKFILTLVWDPKDQNDDLLRFLYNGDSETPFTLLVQGADFSNTVFLEKLILFLSHTNYFKSSKGTPIFFSGTGIYHLTFIEDYLKKNGVTNIDLVILPEIGKGDAVIFLQTENEIQILPFSQFQSYYKKYLESNFGPHDKFLIYAEHEKSKALQQLNEIINIAPDSKYLASILTDVKKLTTEISYKTRQLEMMNGELVIMKELFDLNTKNNEVDHILSFYRKEYEVLPIWYKRVGHIIKAFMGKRSWKSLIKSGGSK